MKVEYPVAVYMSLCPLLMYRVELLSYGGKCDGHRVALCGGVASGVFCVSGS